jgi:hypothetical protein
MTGKKVRRLSQDDDYRKSDASDPESVEERL